MSGHRSHSLREAARRVIYLCARMDLSQGKENGRAREARAIMWLVEDVLKNNPQMSEGAAEEVRRARLAWAVCRAAWDEREAVDAD